MQVCKCTIWWLIGIGYSLAAAADPESPSIHMVDVNPIAAHIDFEHTDGSSGERYIVESLTAGMATLDYDGDGWIDIYFLNGAPLPGSPASSPTNKLYRNLGNWTFSDVTAHAGVGDTGYGLGVVAGDYDADGDTDIYVTNFGANVFYQNNGDGTFTNSTQQAGLVDEGFGAGAALADIDADGDLDLYSANYQMFTFDQHRTRMIGAYQFHPGPHDYTPATDRLFENLGDGTFRDDSQRVGIAKFASTGMGVIASDIDGDGDIDFFVANDSRPNFLWLNDGRGNFTEEAILLGLAYDRAGRANGNMGIDALDFNADGLLDFFTTTYQDEMPVLYQNLGGLFQDATHLAGIDLGLMPHVNWGIGAQDFDHDGDTDLFIACGHFMDNIQYIDDRTRVKVANYMLENRQGRFVNISSAAGSGLVPIESSRSACFDDLDNDGDVDGVVLNFRSRPTLLRNDLESSHGWLTIQLVGTTDNRDAAGAKLTVVSQGRQQIAEVHLGRGYQSSYGRQQYFGLGQAAAVDYVEVRWPNQTTERFAAQPNSHLILIQGQSPPAP